MGAADLLNLIRGEAARLNKAENTGLELGTVISPLPDIAVRIDNMSLLLTSQDILLCERLTVKPLESGDRVLAQALPGGQKYAVIDRVVDYA